MATVSIRIMGKKDDLIKLVEDMHLDDQVLSISRFYPNRGSTSCGRIYIDYEI